MARSDRAATKAHLLLLFVVFVWGSTFVLVKAALASTTPLLFNLLRMALATLVLAVIHREKLRAITRKQLAAGALAGLFLGAGYQFQTFGLTLTTPAKSAFITGMVVVFVPAFTLVPAFRPRNTSRPGLFAAVGAIAAFAGLLYLTTPPGTTLHNLTGNIAVGDVITLGCSIAFAAHLLTLARVSPGIDSGLLATLQIAGATLFMVFTLPLERPHVHFNPTVVIALVICAVFATAAAFTIQSYAQQHLPPTHTVVLLTLEPVFAWLTGLIFLHQSLGRRALLGAALILLGIAIIEFSPTTHSTEIPA
jgi:drug/metabolite transporter (DMT)-like permease